MSSAAPAGARAERAGGRAAGGGTVGVRGLEIRGLVGWVDVLMGCAGWVCCAAVVGVCQRQCKVEDVLWLMLRSEGVYVCGTWLEAYSKG